MKGKGKIMKFFTNQQMTKKIIIAILLVMTFNFIAPITSQAEDTPRGGKLFTPLFQLTCGIADLFIKGMQKIFMGTGDIKSEVNVGVSTGDSKFHILYSPGVIFSNKVPALDVNFFKPNEYKAIEIEEDIKSDGQISTNSVSYDVNTIKDKDKSQETIENERNEAIKACLTKLGVYDYGYDKSDIHTCKGSDIESLYKGIFYSVGMKPDSDIEYWEYDKKIYVLEKIILTSNIPTGRYHDYTRISPLFCSQRNNKGRRKRIISSNIAEYSSNVV